MTTSEIQSEFETRLALFLKTMEEKARASLAHSIKENIPRGILMPEDVANNAVNSEIVHAFSEINDWDGDANFNLAHDLLEDCNLHDYAKALSDFDNKE